MYISNIVLLKSCSPSHYIIIVSKYSKYMNSLIISNIINIIIQINDYY